MKSKAVQYFILLSLILALVIPAALAAADKPIVLKWGDHAAPSVRTRGVDWWIAEVEKLSGGRVKIEPYIAESLVKAKDMPAAVKAGTLDMATFVAAYYPDRMPALNVVDVAGITNRLHVLSRPLRQRAGDPS